MFRVIILASAITAIGCAAGNTTVKSGPDLAREFAPTDKPQIAGGGAHTCGLRSDGDLFCWGRGQEDPPIGKFLRVSGGVDHSCAVRAEEPHGRAVCWGRDDAGQTKAPSGVYRDVAAGKEHTCAIYYSGKIRCWGKDDRGQASPPAARAARAVEV